MDEGWLVMLLAHPLFTFRAYMQLGSKECNKDCRFLLNDLCKFTGFRFFVEISSGVVHKLCMISECSFRHKNLSRQGKNLKFAIGISYLALYEVDYYDLLDLESMICNVGNKMFKSFRRLRMIASLVADVFDGFHVTIMVVLVQHLSLFVKPEAYCFDVLLTFVIGRLLQFHSCVITYGRRMERSYSLSDRFLQFHFHVKAPMGKMEWRSPLVAVMDVMLLSCLQKGNSSSSKWLDLHVRIASQSCVSRQEIWPRLTHEAACSFAEKGLCFKHDMLGWLRCFLYVKSQFQADVVFCVQHQSCC